MRPHVPLELPFVGRDAEMRLLREALEASVAGSRSSFLNDDDFCLTRRIHNEKPSSMLR
jgi:hypothetical protein